MRSTPYTVRWTTENGGTLERDFETEDEARRWFDRVIAVPTTVTAVREKGA